MGGEGEEWGGGGVGGAQCPMVNCDALWVVYAL